MQSANAAMAYEERPSRLRRIGMFFIRWADVKEGRNYANPIRPHPDHDGLRRLADEDPRTGALLPMTGFKVVQISNGYLVSRDTDDLAKLTYCSGSADVAGKVQAIMAEMTLGA